MQVDGKLLNEDQKKYEPKEDTKTFDETQEMMTFEEQETPDEEVLPGLFLSEIASWKKQYNGEVYAIDVKEQTFIIRPLNRFEYKQIIAAPNTDPLMREEMICETCVLYPLEYDFSTMTEAKAGYPAIVSEKIMDFSGFTRDVEVRRL